MIFDTHAHYDDRQFEEDRAELLGSMQEQGVGMIVDAGSDIASWDKIGQLTEQYPFIYGAIGVHPDEVGELDEEKMQRMEKLLSGEKMVAVGEIGLDYYWDKEKRDLQKKWFIRQLELARQLDLTQPRSCGRYDGDHEAACQRAGWGDPLFFLFSGTGERIREHGILSWNRRCCYI